MSKIFGIGLNRIGTTSLTVALRKLGYEIIHDNKTLLTPKIEDIINRIEKTDGAVDTPIPLLYKELDKSFPGSKFILTTRSLKGWLKSIEYFIRISVELTQMEKDLRTNLYGHYMFDKIKYMKAFIKHHWEVFEYFKNRPEDLLMIDIDKNPGWKELCYFLDKPIPNRPFPHEFTTKEINESLKKEGKFINKIFGIGLSKAGTTSLATAFRILGYKTIQYPQPCLLPEMLKIVKKNDMLCDVPIANAYKELDKAFPGSKFILTTRDLESWLKSVRRHKLFHNIIPPHYHKTAQILRERFYGCPIFVEEKWIDKYHKHHEEVLEYFKDRPNDLLVIDFTKGDDFWKMDHWGNLCFFLNKAPPNIPFPHEMDTNKFEKIKRKKIGFVCIMHKSNLRPNGFKLIDNFIDSLYNFCNENFVLYLFDNTSDEKYEVPKYNQDPFVFIREIKYTYIEDQMIRGLAGCYNDGIRMAIKDNCDLIIMVNDDIILNKTINIFIDKVLNHPHKSISIYGPLSNGLHNKSYQLAEKAGKGIREITNEPGQFKNINGFLIAFAPELYHKIKLPNGDLCDMRKKWSGGEEIIQDRARKLGCRMFIIKDCWIHHKRLSGWSKIEKWSK